MKAMKQIHIKMSATLHKQLKVQTVIEDTTIQDYVVQAIEEKLASDVSNPNIQTIKTVEEK